ncbi:hypothetical protein LTR42_006261 [Elasticomyces elasticus]|nr:hypothetical protein LTR42_006261 [Elasticomyces elasticus]
MVDTTGHQSQVPRDDSRTIIVNVTIPKSRLDFPFAIVCVLATERNAVEALFEANFSKHASEYKRVKGDPNVYSYGMLGGWPVVVASPRDPGTQHAADVAHGLKLSFEHLKVLFVVGVAGGAPRTPDKTDILLGDVIISTAVVQYDFGRQCPEGFAMKTEVEDILGRTATTLAIFLKSLIFEQATVRLTQKTNDYCTQLALKRQIVRPESDTDRLFKCTYRHKHQHAPQCRVCSRCNEWDDRVCDEAEKSICSDLGCNDSELERRRSMVRRIPVDGVGAEGARIHFGRVASANAVMRSGVHRDALTKKEKVIAFEMEAAGTWEKFPTVVVKGVCDYSDSHKNKDWQEYAAAMAASCTKAILEEWIIED